MGKYLKKFENHTQYENYINGSGAILPNVSICTTEGDVHYNPSSPVPPTPTETRLVCTYYVEDTSSETTLCYDTYYFSAMEIDGIEQVEIVTAYTFSTTGEHTVKYTLIDPTTIDDNEFYMCDYVTNVSIPSSVTSIGEHAFDNCRSLTSVTIPNSVTSIGDYAFYACDGFVSITMGSGVTSIGCYAFNNSINLTSVTIPNSVTYIGEGAFGCCNSLDATTIAAIEAINPDDAFVCD